MKFYIAHIQFIRAKQKKLVPHQYSGKPIELAEKLILAHKIYAPSQKRNYTSLIFDNFVTDPVDGSLLAALVGKGVQKEVPKHGKNGYYKVKDDQWPNVVLLWDRCEQLILIQKDNRVFSNYESVFISIEDHLNKLLDSYEYRAYIEPKTEEISFWNTINEYEYLYDVNFELHMPNFLGRTHEALAESLNEGKEFNATSLGYSISNPDGNLIVPQNHNIIVVALSWIANGGGWWLIRGKKSDNSKSETVTSKESMNYRTEELNVDLENFSPKNVSSILSEVRPRIAAQKSKDKDDEKDDEDNEGYVLNP